MNDSTTPTLEEQSQPQRERLFYLEFRLYFLGHANRSDLQKRFGLKESSASRDIALYKKLVPNNVVYDYGIKSYIPQDSFQPLFSYSAIQVLTALTHGFGDDYAGPKSPEIVTESPSLLPLPFIPTLAAVTRAIHKKKALSVEYVSDTRGKKVQAIVPHALINSGTHWLVRAYDRDRDCFDDFVINRVINIFGESDTPDANEMLEADDQWNSIVELTLIPHPSLEYPEAVEREFGMHDGTLKMTSKASLQGYLLQQWRVDTSDSPATDGHDYQLYLKR